MKYSKPQIVALAGAVSAIQGSAKDQDVEDTNSQEPGTIAAYEADE